MVTTILTSIKIFMKIQENQQAEQELAIQFKILALDILKYFRYLKQIEV